MTVPPAGGDSCTARRAGAGSVRTCARLPRCTVNVQGSQKMGLPNYTVLREQISGSIFRVMTADAMLTNTFWNFYLDPAE